MGLASNAVCRQPRKLGKAFKKICRDLSPEAVHKLRTRMRRFEAMIQALALGSRKNEHQLAQKLKPLRRRAGRVRDRDVFTQFASRPQLAGENDCSVRLLEHLGAERERQARKLSKAALSDYAAIRKRLKKSARFLDKTFPQRNTRSKPKNGSHAMELADRAAALAFKIEAELRDWPALNRQNLHPFRLEVKKLRYVLQLAEDSDSRFVASLEEVKDSIGQWHDWQELAGVAKEVIEYARCKLRQQIERTAEQKFEEALAGANRLRETYLKEPAGAVEKQTRHRVSRAVISASTLAA
jgi:CHAD domain-containing protein